MTTAQNENLSRGIYDVIRQKLILGELQPGSPLSIRTMAEEFGVSAMPVREALRQLASEQALIGAAKKAYRVPDLTPNAAADLFFVRSVLEGAAAELAVRNMTEVDIRGLERLAGETSAAWAAGDAQAYISSNFTFHSAINARAGNDDLLMMIDALYARTGPWLAQGVVDLIQVDKIEDGHGKIVRALASGDAKEVRRLVEEDAQWAINLFLNKRTS
ncbi:MAG: GntR family transcriptional regulator [Pseudomonadota bacterium]